MDVVQPTIQILLADDDKDDSLLFETVLDELPLTTSLKVVRDGEQLMTLLNEGTSLLPQLVFLDLNMPRKHGYKCLVEIKHNEKFKNLPVVIISTSSEIRMINMLYAEGAKYYIRKPNDFATLKNLIYRAVTSTLQAGVGQPSRENFVLSTA